MEPERLYSNGHYIYYQHKDSKPETYLDYLSSDNIRQAKRYYLKALEKDPNLVAAHLELGILYQNKIIKRYVTFATFESQGIRRRQKYTEIKFLIPKGKQWEKKLKSHLTRASQLGHPRATEILTEFNRIKNTVEQTNNDERDRAYEYVRTQVKDALQTRREEEEKDRLIEQQHPEIRILKQIVENQKHQFEQTERNNKILQRQLDELRVTTAMAGIK